MSSIDKDTKSYKTELILALITAITAISVAVITNWDKISHKSSSNSDNQQQESQKIKYPNSYNFPGNKLIILSTATAQVKSELGWTVEVIEMANIQRDSIHIVKVDIDKYHKYEIILYSEDSTSVFQGEFYNTYLENGADKVYIKNGMDFELLVPEENFNLLYINVENQKFATMFSLVIVSKPL